MKPAELEPELRESYKRDVRSATDLMKRATLSAAKLNIQLVSFLQNGEAPEFDDDCPDLDGVSRFIQRQRQSISERLEDAEEAEAAAASPEPARG